MRTVDWGWNDNVDLAFGAEFRVDQYEINAGDTASWTNGPDDDTATALPTQFGGIAAPGIQVFPGFRPSNAVDELRDATGLYAEAGTMLTDKFFLDFATRWEYYSDFGSTLNGKLAARYDLTDTFGFRGSASTGFRAPSLHQQYFNNTSTQFVTVNGVPNTPVEVGTFNSDSDVVKNGFQVGSLDEETSVNLSGGFTWMPTDNFNLTVDAYYIAIDDRIVLSGRFSAESSDANGNPCVPGSGNCPIADILEPFPGVSAAQFFSNAIDTETTGVDIIAQWRKELSHGGMLQLTGALNLTETELDGDVKTPESLQNAVGGDQTLFSRQEILWLEHGQPQEAFNGAVRYDNGPFSAVLRANYFGEVKSTEDASNTAADQTFDAATLWDIDVGWDFDFGLSLNVGGLNITDETPDENIPGNSFGGIFPYNRRTTPFGFNGGFWYARATFSLDH